MLKNTKISSRRPKSLYKKADFVCDSNEESRTWSTLLHLLRKKLLKAQPTSYMEKIILKIQKNEMLPDKGKSGTDHRPQSTVSGHGFI